jgi:hypothetical protein
MGKDIRKKVGENEYVLVWVPAEDTTLGDAHYIDTKDYEVPTLTELKQLLSGEERKSHFLMFKRLLFQVRDKSISEESYLYFLAGYFGVIPTPEDLKIPEKGSFKDDRW